MAGYIFNLDNAASLQLYTRSGVYATKLSPPSSGRWRPHHEGTFADYCSMKENDCVYFFIDRKIYGIGRLVKLGQDCKFFNFPGAGKPETPPYCAETRNMLLWDEGEVSVNQRCLCVFGPAPSFFTAGVDMDDVLSSNPRAFRMLRAFWKVSFIKVDDEENQALTDVILKRNQDALSAPCHGQNVFKFQPRHAEIAEKLEGDGDYSMAAGIAEVLGSSADGFGIRHEMALEMGIIHQIATREPGTMEIFGQWDYISHQVIASPFKPIDYMDRMDIFGYSYLPGFKPTKASFLVAEIKKDAARIEDVDQLLKYVDWVRDEFCFGDYSMIRSFLVARSFDEGVVEHAKRVAVRRYVSGMRPARSLEWRNVALVEYRFDAAARLVCFDRVH